MDFDYISTEDGLAHPTVIAIAQDAKGFLWFGTRDGLHRYDGFDFEIFLHEPSDPDSLANNNVMEILVDSQGELWIGTNGSGLDRFVAAEERFEHFAHDPEDPTTLSHHEVWSLLEDQAGKIWVGTEDGLNRLDRPGRGFRRFLHHPDRPGSLPGRRVMALAEDTEGTLWVGAEGGGLSRFNAANETFESVPLPSSLRGPGQGTVLALATDQKRNLWIGTDEGFGRLHLDTGEVSVYQDQPGMKAAFSLRVDAAGEVWIGSYTDGLGRYNLESDSFNLYRSSLGNPRGLSSNTIFHIFEDREGTLWIGTRLGVNRYHRLRDSFETFHARSEDSPGAPPSRVGTNLVRGLHEDDDGKIWLGTDQGLAQLDRQRGSFAPLRLPAENSGTLENQGISQITEDSDGNLWFGFWFGGAAKLNADKNRVTYFRHDPQDPTSLPDHQVREIYEDSHRRLWFGTYNGLCHIDLDHGHIERHPQSESEPDSLGYASFWAIQEDRIGALWFASLTGLYRRDPTTDRFELFRRQPEDPHSLSHNATQVLYESRDGVLWIGTLGGGLNRFDSDRGDFRHYRKSDGLAGDAVEGILEDKDGQLWISTNDGLSRFDPATEVFHNYTSQDGLQGNAFSTSSALQTRDGEMLFGGFNGLTAFFAENIQETPEPPPVVITRFSVYNEIMRPRRIDPTSLLERSILETSKIELTHRDAVFDFEFAALDYNNPRRIRYSYRLEGVDPGWISTDPSRRFAQYSNLKPGPYTFRVKARGARGGWNEEGASIDLLMRPSPWFSGWAMALYALILTLAVGGVLAVQKLEVDRQRGVNRRLVEIDQMKDELFAKTSHELRTPLFGIVGMAETLRAGARGRLPQNVDADLEIIISSGQRLSELVDDILDYSKLKRGGLELRLGKVDLRGLTELVLALSRPLAEPKGLRMINAIAEDLPPIQADEKRLEQILHNLVGNAVKFSSSGSVTISSAQCVGGLEISVTDTGIGIAAEQMSCIFNAYEQAESSDQRAFGGTGLGLAVTRQLVELHGGHIKVDSSPGQGSTFTFLLPQAATLAARTPTAPEKTPRAAPSPMVPTPAPQAPIIAISPAVPIVARILIVDDEPVNRVVLVRHLESRGYQVDQASHGASALEMLEEQTFDLVLLDVMMPKMSGYEVCSLIRQRHSLENLPVLLLTARSQTRDLISGFEAGASDYLVKPIAKSELLARVRTHLDLLFTHRHLSQLSDERSAQLKERSQLLYEKEELIGSLEQRNSELQRFNRAISHDLRNPLVTIRTYLGILKRDLNDGQGDLVTQDLNHIDRAARELDQLLHDLTRLADLDGDPPSLHPVDLLELAQEVADSLAETIRKRGLILTVAPDLPTIHGHRGLLRDLFQHLLDNALKFTSDVDLPRVTVGTRDGEVIYVEDNGAGIESPYHEKIFGLFERLDLTIPGTGIGLALVQRIVEVHGGRVWVESPGQDQGSTFCFTLRR